MENSSGFLNVCDVELLENILEMKRIYTITTIIMAALAIAGCAKELEENNQVPKEEPKEEPKDDPKVEDGTMVLGAMLPDYPDASDYDAAAQSADTKTTISDNGDKTYSVHWAEGDAIFVNGKTSKNININPDNPKSAKFTLDVIDAPYCAVYPAGAIVADSFSAESDTLNVTVPATQEYSANDFDSASAIMSAYTESAADGLTFKHAMAYIKLTVTNTAVKSVRINGNNNEAISGVFTIKFSKNGNSFAPRKDEKGKTKGNTSVTYFNGDSGIAANTPMFIAIPAADYQKGLTFTIVDSENRYQVKKTSAFTAQAGKVYPTEAEFVADGTYVEGGIYTAEDWNNFILDLNAGKVSDWVTTIGSDTGIHIMANIECQTNLEASNTKVSLENIVYGHGHTITHHPVRPLFTNVGTEGGILDLTIAGDTDTWDNSGWAGIFVTNNEGKIEKCINNVNLTLDKREIKTLDNGKPETIIVAAGICRTNKGSIVNCTNNGKIDIRVPANPVRIGGIIVYNGGGTISGCHNNGDISVTGVDKDCVVGGVAYAISGKGTGLENYGNITVDANLTAVRTIYIGGVAANAEYNGVSTSFKNCSNSGNLSLIKSGKSAIKGCALAGIVAAINQGTKGTDGKDFTSVESSSNTGKILFEEAETSNAIGYAIGGVVGRCVDASGSHYGATGYYTVIRQSCSNEGVIEVYSSNGSTVSPTISGARETYVGGLAGYVSGYYDSVKKESVNAIVRGVNSGNIISGSLNGGDIVGGSVGGGAYLLLGSGGSPAVTGVTISKYNKSDCKNGFVGAMLGWATSQGTVSIENASANVTFDSSLTPSDYGFAGVTGGKVLSVSKCKFQGLDVKDTDIYGGGTATMK